MHELYDKQNVLRIGHFKIPMYSAERFTLLDYYNTNSKLVPEDDRFLFLRVGFPEDAYLDEPKKAQFLEETLKE